LAANQREALTYLRAEFFSVVITDFMLDGLGEPERIARSILEAAHPVPVGCLTGGSNLPAGISHQFAFVLHKPVTPENILTAIRSLFSPRRDDLHRATVVESYFAGLNAANWDLVASLCSDRMKFNPPPDERQTEPIAGKHLFRRYAEDTFRSFANRTFGVQSISFLPNGVIARYLARCESDSGEKVQHRGEVLFRFDGHLISEIGVRVDVVK